MPSKQRSFESSLARATKKFRGSKKYGKLSADDNEKWLAEKVSEWKQNDRKRKRTRSEFKSPSCPASPSHASSDATERQECEAMKDYHKRMKLKLDCALDNLEKWQMEADAVGENGDDEPWDSETERREEAEDEALEVHP